MARAGRPVPLTEDLAAEVARSVTAEAAGV